MSVIIPLRPLSATSVPAERSATGLLFPLRLGGSTTGTVQQREQEVLKAVAAAVAVSHTPESLTLARNAQKEGEDPGARFKAAIAKPELAVVINEVRRVQNNRTGAAVPNEEQRVVAAAVAADPVLVAAAHAKVVADAVASEAARDWVASIDPVLLERAARAGARREVLNPGEPSADDLKKLNDKLDAEIKKNNDKLYAITNQLPAPGQLQNITERLEALERGKSKG